MNYYAQKQFIAHVDKSDNILEKVEKWEAHKKGILHRAFSMVLQYKDCYILQQRKHPAFDGYFDLSFSSHQIYVNDALQTDLEAIYQSLDREWNMDKSHLVFEPKFLGKIYYKAKDPNSEFTEHEVDYIYIVEIKILPMPNFDFAHGFLVLDKKSLTNSFKSIKLAPWVKEIIGKLL